jgi:hypothetical protein
MESRRIIAFAALAALALFPALSCAQSPTPVPATTPWFQSEYDRVAGTWDEWGPVAALAVLVSVFAVAFAYMIGIGFDVHGLRAWAKSEMYQAIASAIIVGGLAAMTWVMLDEGASKILGHNLNPYSASFTYLDDLEKTLKGYYRWFYMFNFPLEATSSFSFYENASGIDIPIAFFLKPLIVEPLHLASYYVVQALVLVSMWKAVLIFFRDAAFATFLPLGVFLRIFPFTRGAGGLLIAIAIGMFIVFPTMFGFVALLSQDDQALGEQLANLEEDHPPMEGDPSSFTTCEHDLEAVLNEAEAQTDPSTITDVTSYYSFLPGIMLKVLFYPIVVMAATVTFIKVLSPLLGADISEIGQGLVRLI